MPTWRYLLSRFFEDEKSKGSDKKSVKRKIAYQQEQYRAINNCYKLCLETFSLKILLFIYFKDKYKYTYIYLSTSSFDIDSVCTSNRFQSSIKLISLQVTFELYKLLERTHEWNNNMAHKWLQTFKKEFKNNFKILTKLHFPALNENLPADCRTIAALILKTSLGIERRKIISQIFIEVRPILISFHS